MTMHSIELPGYREQSEQVRDRFDRLKRRPVRLEVKGLSKEFDRTQGYQFPNP
jgi:NitT/TauT family transport system ATP-binding protein